MEACTNCFSDKELQGFILSFEKFSNCSVCGSKEVAVVDIDELQDFFQELIDNFRILEGGTALRSRIQENWSFFATHAVSDEILNHVLPNLNTEIHSSQDAVEYIDDVIECVGYWEIFKEDIKWSQRFISNIGQLEEYGWDGFFNPQYLLSNADRLYRARVHHQSGLEAFSTDKMKCPPAHEATAGRANPMGIPFLYLSDKSETVLYEVRASFLDELSIGTFQLVDGLDPIKIVDFTEDTDLFTPGNVNSTIKGKLLREKISKDLSKPMRRYDSEIEYLPTQFICEFIKVFTGASGIRFSSSLHPSGKNIVIFDQDLLHCTEVKLNHIHRHKVEAIEK